MNKKPYLIVAPHYVNCCAGIKVLHRLAYLLNSKGYEAYVSSSANPEFATQTLAGLSKEKLAELKETGIVVYPEIVQGNPLKFNNVAHWDLNKPVHNYPESDLVFVYNEILLKYSKARDVLNIYYIEDYFCNPALENRVNKCFWIGKGAGTPLIKETEGITQITHGWPSNRKELAELFQSSEVFYTYDNFTVLIDEARLCGCPVVIIPSGQIDLVDFDHMTLGREGLVIYPDVVKESTIKGLAAVTEKYSNSIDTTNKQLDNFIALTQAMHNTSAGDYSPINAGWESWIPEELFR